MTTTPNGRRRTSGTHGPAAEVLPELTGRRPTDELMRRSRERRIAWLRAYDSEEEIAAYVEQAIDEVRQQERRKARAEA